MQTIATGLRIPWGIAFLPDGTALVTERGNAVPRRGDDPGGVARIMSVSPAGEVTEVQRLPEVDLRSARAACSASPSPRTTPPTGGSTSTTAQPTTTASPGSTSDRRPADPDRHTRSPADGGRYHQGGRLAFGPDGMLYASVGETYFDSEIAQDRNSLGGKILRMTPDGKPAPGNPFPDSLVWSYGHRNVQGLAWDGQGRMYASEFGSKTYDELNVIEPGRNYGWPLVEGFSTDPAAHQPHRHLDPDQRRPRPAASPSSANTSTSPACAARPSTVSTSTGATRAGCSATTAGCARSRSHRTDRCGSPPPTATRSAAEDGLPQTPEGDRILRVTLPLAPQPG